MLTLEWEDDIAVLRMDDPATRNAVTLTMLDAFDRALDDVETRGRAMVLTGAGTAFCSGANLLGGMGTEEMDPEHSDLGLPLETHINPLMHRLRNLAVPWITAVRGAAAGMGASFALAGDLVVASETAVFVQAFSRVGLVPDSGATHLLVRTIGRVRAMELMLLGERLSAQAALDLGLINRVVPDDALEAESMLLAKRLATGAASLGMIRKLAWLAVDGDWSGSLAAERSSQRAAGRTADYQEGLAAFTEKRATRFVGR